MQNYCKTIGALAAASALVAGNALAGTPTPTPAPVTQPAAAIQYEMHTGYSSEYLYRGVNLGQDLIEVGADVKGEMNGFGLSAGAWYGTVSNSSLVGFRLPYDLNMTELDLYAEASYKFGDLKTSVGYIYRIYDLDMLGTQNTAEVYFGLGYDFGFVNASLTYYWGVNGVDVYGYTPGTTDGYTELALNRSFELSPCWNINLSTNVGYLVEGGEWTSWTSKVSLDWGFAEHAKLSPFVALGIGLGESENTLWYSTTNQLVGGCMLSVNF
jgi:hypothetical protein